MNYSDLITALGDLLIIPITDPNSATPSSDTNFNNILPRLIDAGEQRIYRDMDFLVTRTTDVSTMTTANFRNSPLPTATTFITIESANIITPAGATLPAGKRNRVELVSKDFIDLVWPDEQSIQNQLPEYAVQFNETYMIFAPTPDAAYTVEYTGTFRPAPISSTNPTTYLATTYPDLLLAACMTFGFMYQRDADAPSPGHDLTDRWNTNYKDLKDAVMEEVQRQKIQGRNWSPYSSTPLSTPPRP